MTRLRGLFLLGCAVAVLSLTAGGSATAGGAKVWDDPDAGLTAQQREAAQSANSDAFWTHYASWIKEQAARSVDPRSYPVDEAMAFVSAPLSNLREATSASALVIHGVVEDLEFRATADAVAWIRTTETLKGAATDDRVGVILPNALLPGLEDEAPRISEIDAMPMIYPGDEVLLFLVPDLNYPGMYDLLPWTGRYLFTDGKIEATKGNPFAAAVEKLTPAAFLDSVKTGGGA